MTTKMRALILGSIAQGTSFTALVWCAWPLGGGRLVGVVALAIVYAATSSYNAIVSRESQR